MIGIRADANETIAAGHIMRCMTIAKQLRRKGEQVLFFVADGCAVPMLEKEGMDYVCLNSRWDRLEEELPELTARLRRAGCRKLLVDSYQATVPYLTALREEAGLIYIDDLFEDVYPVELLINYNAYHRRFPYGEAYAGKGVRLLLGPAYVPLREEFLLERSREVEDSGLSCGQVLVSCGGGDVHDVLSGILTHALARVELREVVFHTVVGRFHKNAERLRAMAGDNPRIRLYERVDRMAELMAGCDAAVSAAGTVLYELCAVQVPAVFYVCADNQEYDSDFFAEEGRMLFAGDVRSDREECLERICDGLERLVRDRALRGRMRGKLGEVTDGRGAERIAEEILGL